MLKVAEAAKLGGDIFGLETNDAQESTSKSIRNYFVCGAKHPCAHNVGTP